MRIIISDTEPKRAQWAVTSLSVCIGLFLNDRKLEPCAGRAAATDFGRMNDCTSSTKRWQQLQRWEKRGRIEPHIGLRAMKLGHIQEKMGNYLGGVSFQHVVYVAYTRRSTRSIYTCCLSNLNLSECSVHYAWHSSYSTSATLKYNLSKFLNF